MVLHLELTHKCNANCKFCFRDREDKSEDMPLSLAKKISDDAFSLGFKRVRLLGFGEPILYKQLPEFIDYAGDFLEPDLNTNAFALTEAISDKLVKSKLRRIVFSVTGISAEVFNKFQGTGMKDDSLLKRVYSNIECFLRKRSEAQSRIITVMQFILTEDSKCDFKKYSEYWKDKVDEINFTPMSDDYLGFTGDNGEIPKPVRKCYNGVGELQVFANGDVRICPIPGTTIGSIKHGGNLADAFNSDCYKRYKNAHVELETDALPEVCKSCAEIFNYNLEEMLILYYSKIRVHIDNAARLLRLKGKKVAFYGANLNALALLWYFSLYESMDYFDFVIVDKNVKGYMFGKPVQKPSDDLLRGRTIIIFAELAYAEIANELEQRGFGFCCYQNI